MNQSLLFRCLLYWFLLIVIGCKKASNEGREYLDTSRILRKAITLFDHLDFESAKIDLRKNIGATFLVENIIPADFYEIEYIDGWGNPISCMTDGSILYIWSNGRNGLNDNMAKDDIVSKISIHEKFQSP